MVAGCFAWNCVITTHNSGRGRPSLPLNSGLVVFNIRSIEHGNLKNALKCGCGSKVVFGWKMVHIIVNTSEEVVESDNREHGSKVVQWLRKSCTCDMDTLREKVPIVRWLPKYRRSYVIYDFIAGITVALTAIPQGIAYGVLAGLEPQYGLYSEIMPGVVYMVFGSCNYITIGKK